MKKLIDNHVEEINKILKSNSDLYVKKIVCVAHRTDQKVTAELCSKKDDKRKLGNYLVAKSNTEYGTFFDQNQDKVEAWDVAVIRGTQKVYYFVVSEEEQKKEKKKASAPQKEDPKPSKDTDKTPENEKVDKAPPASEDTKSSEAPAKDEKPAKGDKPEEQPKKSGKGSKKTKATKSDDKDLFADPDNKGK